MSILLITTQKKVSRTLAKKTREITEHVISCLAPDKVFMIGSMARGVIRKDSDLDLVIVINRKFRRQDLVMKTLPCRPHFDVPLDLHIVAQKEFEEFKDLGGICFEAAHHGKLIYEAEMKS